MPCGVFWQQVNTLDRALSDMRSFGFSVDFEPLRILSSARTQLMRQIGVKLPRIVQLLIKFVGMSPGVVSLWHDNENGFMSEARITPGSPPIYKIVSAPIAMKILSHDISPELEAFLMTPDVDIDN